MNTNSNNEKSAYNEGLLQIGRLDEVWVACKRRSVNDDLCGWALELEAGWRELSRDAEKLNNKYKSYIKKYNLLIGKCFKKINSNLGSNTKILNRSLLRQILTEKEILLRRIQDEAGKGSKYEDQSEFDFEL
jgi:hypothetical protein